MLTEKKLETLLDEVRQLIPNHEFCGVGLVVCSNIAEMPIASLCTNRHLPNGGTLAEQIAQCSIASNPCHDGFHFINESWNLEARNQYFAPFIPKIEIGISSPVGSRHVTAHYGSLMKHVLCTGLLSERDGLLVFVDGKIK